MADLTDAQKALLLNLERLQYFKGKMVELNDSKYVAKEENKSLMTSDEHTKLSGIADGAEVNVIESIVLDDTASTNSVADKVATLGMSSYAKKSDVVAAVHYKGTVATYADLPTEGMSAGDMYNITSADATHDINAGDNVVWNADDNTWDNQRGTIDMSGKVDVEEGKTLTSNDFTDTLKSKLDGIEEGAEVNVIEKVSVDGTELEVTDKGVNIDLSNKVDKATGKSLVADTEIARLANMSDGANKTEVSAEYTAGLKVATVTIDGNATAIYAPICSTADIDALF